MPINEDIVRLLISIVVVALLSLTFLLLSRKFSKSFPELNFKIPILLATTGMCGKVFLVLNRVSAYQHQLNTILYTLLFFSIVKILDLLIKGTQNKAPATRVKIPRLIHDIILGLIYFVVFFSIMKMELGIDLAPILTTSAVVSMVLGLALQDTLTNFIAGVIIHIEKPFSLYNWVMVSEIEGKVMEINWRTTKVLTFDNDFLVIPNSSILKNSIMNFNYPTSNHIMMINVGTSYQDAPNKVKNVLMQVANHTKNVLKNPQPSVRLIKYNDFSIDYEIRLWINNYSKKKTIENELLTSIWYAFEREGIEIPLPKTEVYMTQNNQSPPAVDQVKLYEKLKLDLIRSVDFFAELPAETLQEVSNLFKRQIYGKDEILFEEGEEGDSFFIIQRGCVSVSLKDRKIAELGQGDFFGEMSLLTGKKRNATIKSLEDSEFLVVDKEKFSKIVTEDPKSAEKISKVIADRKQADDRIRALAAKEQEIKSCTPHQETEDEKTILTKIKDFFNIS